VLWILGKINLILPFLQTITFKLPAILSDVITGYLIYKIISKIKNEKWGQFGAILYLFNPAIFANSTLWGQVDSLTALFSLFAVYLFPINYWLSAISLAIGTLMKPQAAFVLPAILYLLITHKKKLYEWFNYGATGLIVFILGFLPFSNQTNFFKFVLSRLTVSSGQYPYGSVNAFSFWGLFGFWKPDNITFWIDGVSFQYYSMIIYRKKIVNGEYLVSSFSLLITFLFMTRMHERHLLPVLAPLLVATVSNPILFLVYGGLSLTYIANLSYAYVWIADNYKEIFNPTLVKFFITLNLSLFVVSIVSIFKKISINFKPKLVTINKTTHFFTKDITNKKAYIYLSVILLFSILTRIYALAPKICIL
jgi:hypothetical protein